MSSAVSLATSGPFSASPALVEMVRDLCMAASAKPSGFHSHVIPVKSSVFDYTRIVVIVLLGSLERCFFLFPGISRLSLHAFEGFAV